MIDQTGDITVRSLSLASRRGSSYWGPEHLLAVVLEGEEVGAAQIALRSGGVSLADLSHWFEAGSGGGDLKSGTSPSPRFCTVSGLAAGLALAGGEEASDVHALLALVYEGFIGELVGRDQVLRIVGSLKTSGVAVPSRPPPEPSAAPNLANRVYYPESDHSSVIAEMIRRSPPPSGPKWGFNISVWLRGFHWLDSEQSCDAASIVRDVCADPTRIVELPVWEAASNEQSAQA